MRKTIMRCIPNHHPACLRSLVVLFAIARATTVLADGGAVRAIVRDGGLQISVFTSPAVLVAGEADISVLVQDAETLTPVIAAEVDVEVVPRGRTYAAVSLSATSDAATNKLFRACHLILESGEYEIEVIATAGGRRGNAHFEMSVGPPPGRASAFWPWYTWPALPILLLAAHAWRARPARYQRHLV